MMDIYTGSNVFNELFESYKSGKFTTIYGPAATGKTTACYLAAISCAAYGFKTIFVDTEGSFSADRINQLTRTRGVLENILYLRVNSWKEQCQKMKSLFEISKNSQVKLIILDSLSHYFRLEIQNEKKENTRMLVEQLRDLKHIARDNRKIVIATSQVYSAMEKGIKPIGGLPLERISDYMVLLDMVDDKRIASMSKPKTENRYSFEIKEQGVFLI